jgi:hypothetical protein
LFRQLVDKALISNKVFPFLDYAFKVEISKKEGAY